jgi:hypothetical protein
MNKFASIASYLCIAVSAQLLGACVSQHPQPGTDAITDAQTTVLEAQTTPQNTGYADPRVSQPRTVFIDQLSKLKGGDIPYTDELVFLSFAQKMIDKNTAVPMAFAVGHPLDEASKTIDHKKMKAGISYSGCTYALTYLGADENNFQYFKGTSHDENCNVGEVIRVEAIDKMTLRISGHDSTAGLEQWGGIFNGRPIPPST